ncbi:hypothetical protein JVU11DRAFT_9492 [Chiua virens]|nr:hypothetical protein JVU11DRAFT_9492 [Chiua virens]
MGPVCSPGEFEHNCMACHLIPHSKGDDYMSKLFDYRGQMYDPGMDPVVDISDARNGILLNDGFYRPLYRGEITFLKTPNFALGVEDVPYSHQPPPTAHPETRLTLQHIRPDRIGPALRNLSPHNTDARQPEDMSLWPLAIIVDLRYGSAAVQAWGPQAFLDRVRTVAGHSYDDDDDGKGEGKGKGRSAGTGQYELRSRKKKTQAVDTTDQQTYSDAFDIVMMLWLRAAREGKRRQSCQE